MIRTGSCSQCGQCCFGDFVTTPHMLNLSNKTCKYLTETSPGFYICEITTNKFSDPEDKDMKEVIPKEDYEYWKRECQLYPNPNDVGHQPPRHKLPSKCTYKIELEESSEVLDG